MVAVLQGGRAHGGIDRRTDLPQDRPVIRRSNTTVVPLSSLWRMRRPMPCLSPSTAWGVEHSLNGSANWFERASTTGSEGTRGGVIDMYFFCPHDPHTMCRHDSDPCPGVRPA